MKLLWERTIGGGYLLELPFLQLLIYEDRKERKGWFYVIYNSNAQVLSSSETLPRFPTKEDAEKACVYQMNTILFQQVEVLQRRMS